MTRKHFVALAAALRETNASVETIVAVARVCKQANPHFDFLRFSDAATPPAKVDA